VRDEGEKPMVEAEFFTKPPKFSAKSKKFRYIRKKNPNYKNLFR
jgi:hypothetical protein